MTLSLEKLSQSSTVLQQRNATWQDYTQARDRTNWNKIAFHQGWLWIDKMAVG